MTEAILQKVYDNKHAKFIQFVKHILGIEVLTTFSETVSKAFDEYIQKHNTYNQNQMQFLLTLKSFILQNEKVEKKDLINSPFTQFHPKGIRGIFPSQEINEILQLVSELVA